MSYFLVFDGAGVECRRGSCPAEMIPLQPGAGETVHEYEPSPSDPAKFQRDPSGALSAYVPAPDPQMQWEEAKAVLAATLAAGYASTYGPVDLREGAKAAMMGAVTLDAGLDLILLDNSIVTLSPAQVRTLFADAIAWEQARVMETQALRP